MPQLLFKTIAQYAALLGYCSDKKIKNCNVKARLKFEQNLPFYFLKRNSIKLGLLFSFYYLSALYQLQSWSLNYLLKKFKRSKDSSGKRMNVIEDAYNRESAPFG